MENEEYGIKLRLLTSGFKTALKRTVRETKTYGEEMEKSTTISPKAGVAILGVVGALALMAKATNNYIKSDKQLQGELEIMGQVINNMVSALGNALAPAIKGVINVAEYAIIVLAKLIQLFTGFNALENINNDNLDKTTKKAKAASKALAGFDTLTTLTSSSGSGAKDIGISTDAMKTFQDKVAEVDKIFEDYGTQIKAATIALGVFVGAKMLGKIASFIGVAGKSGAAGTGLMGIASALGWIAGLGVLAIEISLIINGIQEWNQFKADMEEQNKKAQKNNKLQSEKTQELVDKYKELANQENRTKEQEREMIMIRKGLVEVNDSATRNYQSEWHQLQNLIKSTGPWSKATKEQVGVLESLNTKSLNQVLALEELATSTDLSTEEVKLYIKEIERQIKLAETNAKEIKLMGGNYEDATKEVDSMRESLGKIKSKYSAEVDIKANTKDAEKSMSNFISKVINSGLGNIPVFSSIKNLFKFDVGTNYVPQDMTAVVHKGEMIVPKKYNPSTSGLGVGSEETNALLRQLNETLENKQFSASISQKAVGEAATNYINQQNRIMGRSVV